jgi:hypothetical protein
MAQDFRQGCLLFYPDLKNLMSEKLDPKEIVTFEELLMSNVYTQEALINLLDQNGQRQ